MTILHQVRRQLYQAAERRSRPRWYPRRVGSTANLAAVLGVLVAVAVGGLAVALLAHQRPAAAPLAGRQLGPSLGTGDRQLYGKRRGGVLAAYSSDGFQSLDPGQSYGSEDDYAIDAATQRPLFAVLPTNSAQLVPDLASTVPTAANGGITDGGTTITVHIRPGIRFSPPVSREVTSADVAYAIERAANPDVANPYFAAYFGSRAPAPLLGAQSTAYRGGPIPGIQTPDRFTIVFHTLRPSGSFLVRALTLPISAPVPESFAGPLDAHDPTTYGTRYLVATGPYMVQSGAGGLIAGVGFRPAVPPAVPALGRLTLVRNPNWNPSTDYRPAYLERIDVVFGGDPDEIGHQVLTGRDSVQLDPPAPGAVELGIASHPRQLAVAAGAGEQYIALDNASGPFRSEDLRKAVWAALDRRSIAAAASGAVPGLAQPMTHFLYPGIAGFQQAGGDAGPSVDYNSDADGNLATATRYMKLAGYRDGRYTGRGVLRVVSADTPDQRAITQIVSAALSDLGFHTTLTLVNPSLMYTKYCAVPRQEIDVCPSVGWSGDFGDPMTVLEPTFHGPATESPDNADFGQVDDPAIAAAMDRAALVIDPIARAEAWAAIDRLLVEHAVAVPEAFTGQVHIESVDVAGVPASWNGGTWDLDFTSLR